MTNVILPAVDILEDRFDKSQKYQPFHDFPVTYCKVSNGLARILFILDFFVIDLLCFYLFLFLFITL